jgi:hypothetical protein
MKSDQLHPLFIKIARAAGADTTMDNRLAISRWLDLSILCESMVRECARVAATADTGVDAATAIKKHFGVEP